MVMTHDPLCYLYRDDGEYNLMADRCSNCKLIAQVRADEGPKAVTRWIEQGAGSDDWMKVWQVRDYAEELEAKVRANCLEKVEGAYIVGNDGKVLNPSHPEYSHDGTETWNNAVSTAVAYMTGEID